MTQAQVDQLAVEALRTNEALTARVDQLALEVLRIYNGTTVQVSQVVVEVLRPNPVETPVTYDVGQFYFSAGQLFALPLPGEEAQTPVQIGVLQGVTVDFTFSAKALHDSGGAWPVAAGRGTARIACRADSAQLSAEGFNTVFFGGDTPRVGRPRAHVDERATVTGGSVTAADAAAFLEDLGVISADDGLIYVRVAAAPDGLQYAADDAGGYSFGPSEEGREVLVSYLYDDATSGRTIDWRNQLSGHTPRFTAVLTETFDGKALTLVLNACAAGKVSMRSKVEDFLVASFTFSAAANDAGVIGTLSME